MIIGLDVDGVLRDWANSLRDAYLRHNPREHVPPVDGWWQYDIVPCFGKWKNQFDAERFYAKEHPFEIYLGAKAYDGASAFVKKIRRDIGPVHIVSNQPNKLVEELTVNWLDKEGILYDGITFTKDKHRQSINVLVDDCTDNLNSCRQSLITPIAFRRPWNNDWYGLSASSYQEIFNMLKLLGRK